MCCARNQHFGKTNVARNSASDANAGRSEKSAVGGKMEQIHEDRVRKSGEGS